MARSVLSGSIFPFPGKNGKGRNDWDSENLLKLARSLQPGIIVDDRLDLRDVEGGWDFTTPEQVKVTKWPEVYGKKSAMGNLPDLLRIMGLFPR